MFLNYYLAAICLQSAIEPYIHTLKNDLNEN